MSPGEEWVEDYTETTIAATEGESWSDCESIEIDTTNGSCEPIGAVPPECAVQVCPGDLSCGDPPPERLFQQWQVLELDALDVEARTPFVTAPFEDIEAHSNLDWKDERSTFYWARGVGKLYELSTEPIEVEVTSLLGEQRAELVIEDIEDVVDMPKKSSLWWIWVLIIALLAIVAGAFLFLRRKRAAELIRIFKPAHEIAYARLRALIKEDLVAADRIKEFYDRISSILRHYIEHRFDLRAPERTTEEFLAELQYTDVLGARDKESLAEFLTHCDLVKFARHSPTNEQIQKTFNLVKEFIAKTRSEERKIDVTDSVRGRDSQEAEVA